MRYIFHVDVNSAFLSWSAVYRLREQGEELDLRTVPAVIGGNEDSRQGIVLAKSVPCKRYGIETAEPLASARRKCPGLIIEPSNFTVYRKYSHEFISLLRSYATEVYQYSIDEAWAVFDDCENIYGDMVEFAYKLKDEIYEKLGFTVNIGVSQQFLLAKIAGDFEKPNKVHTLFIEEREQKLWPLPVNVLLYVGRKMTESLRKLGIMTVKDLYDADPAVINSNLGKFGMTLWNNVHGEDLDPSIMEEADQKGYGNSTTTPKDTTDWDRAKEILIYLADNIGSRLRSDGVYASCICVTVRYPDFTHISKQMVIENAINSTTAIYENACKILELIWDGKRPIRQLGIRATKVVSDRYEQLSLFGMTDDGVEDRGKDDTTVITKPSEEKRNLADSAMDELNRKMGKKMVKRGREIK